MPTIINPIITNAGLAAAQAQSGLGLQLAITHVSLGSGGYTLDTSLGSADRNRTGLVTQKEVSAIAGGHVTGKGFRVDAFFGPWTLTTYGASEIGFWAGDPTAGGTLFAYWAQSTAFVQRNNIDYLSSFAVALAGVPDGSVTVTFDPDLQKAIALITYHEQAADPHPQYVERAGDTMNGPLLLAAGATPAQFDASAKVPSAAFVKAALGSMRGTAAVAGASTLTATAIGKVVVCSGSSAYAVMLPSAGLDPNGGHVIGFHNIGTGVVTVQRAGTDSIYTGAVSQSSVALQPGDTLLIVASGGAAWYSFAGSVALKDTPANPLGRNQGWQSLAASRAINTTYTNTTGRAIAVCCGGATSGANGGYSIQVGGVVADQKNTVAGEYFTVKAIIPPGATYVLSKGGADTFSSLFWAELR